MPVPRHLQRRRSAKLFHDRCNFGLISRVIKLRNECRCDDVAVVFFRVLYRGILRNQAVDAVRMDILVDCEGFDAPRFILGKPPLNRIKSIFFRITLHVVGVGALNASWKTSSLFIVTFNPRIKK